ncbi:MAG: GntR family transcriptional regulator [Burkholderiales bacterium]|jgi:DNA-binding GntR family transcriptional regulator|nr:GntR family transcriptional regulator [Burkholderiales bacterium]
MSKRNPGAAAPADERLARYDEEGTTLGERVRVILSERLIAGEYSPGSKLSLRKLADTLGVSMTPVREAINRLVADRAVEVTPNRAVRVPTMTVSQFRELTQLRIDIEGMAAFRAAGLRNDADIPEMEVLEAAFREEGRKKKPDLAKVVAANQRLHFAIYRATRSSMLVEIISGLWLKAGPILNLDMRSSPERLASSHALGLHAAAVEAIARRDGEAARAAIAADIHNASEFIIARKVLPE